MESQSQIASKRFLLENNVEEEKIYHYDEQQLQILLSKERPWKTNPEHFKKVRISAVALIKMALHAQSGGEIEVMGVMQGYPVGDTMYVMDVFGLPVVGTETRVSANDDAAPFQLDHQDKSA
jgi:COP9 signalosome complex subunit 5